MCGYDFGDCDECSNAESCQTLWRVMETISNFVTSDYMMDETEACSLWFLVEGYSLDLRNNTEFPWNCTTLIPAFDRDGNNKLNGYESVFLVNNNSTRSKQINCSMCADTVADYYAY